LFGKKCPAYGGKFERRNGFGGFLSIISTNMDIQISYFHKYS